MAEKKLKMEFSKELVEILTKLEKQGDYVAWELMIMTDPDPGSELEDLIDKEKIELVDVAKNDYCFNVKMRNGQRAVMKIGAFIRKFFGDFYSSHEIEKFSNLYNRAKGGSVDGKAIEVAKFSYDPKDVRKTFLSLVTKTYPHGHEDEVLQFLPELRKDQVGNYYTMIGGERPETMFTSHLDTADRNQKITSLFSTKEGEDEVIVTDGNSVLGADDKSGVAVMLYMMAHSVPGLYYFFIGEERGGIGSHALADVFDEVGYLQNLKRCVSFDRRNYHSIITSQMGAECCSDEFAEALCDAYNANGMSMKPDDTGIYTDSASFMDEIPECTNVSVGYFNEHTGKEKQNISFLERLCAASVKIDWSALPTKRSLDEIASFRKLEKEAREKHKDLLEEFKGAAPFLERVVSIEGGKTYVCFDLEGSDIATIHETLEAILSVMKTTKNRPDIAKSAEHNWSAGNCYVEFDETYLKIRID
jgi:hypothetical protein